jgi:hypothetical protein
LTSHNVIGHEESPTVVEELDAKSGGLEKITWRDPRCLPFRIVVKGSSSTGLYGKVASRSKIGDDDDLAYLRIVITSAP